MHFLVYTKSERMTRSAGWYEPPDYGRDVWEGDAPSRTQARKKAFRDMCRQGLEPFFETLVIAGFEDCPVHGSNCRTAAYGEIDHGTYPFVGHFGFGVE